MAETHLVIRQFEYHVTWRRETLWYAAVEIGGELLWFTRFDEEKSWYCDAHFSANGYPYFCDGEGSRCCRKRAAIGSLAAALDERKQQWGDRPAVVPLVLQQKGA
jgi:hypothetical protein